MKLVLDASMAGAWCFPDERTPVSQQLLDSLTGPDTALVPPLWIYEIHNLVLKGLRRDRIGQSDATKFLESLTALHIRPIDDQQYSDVLVTALRFNRSFYDAAYLNLAIREGVALASLDNGLRDAARQAGVPLYGEET